MKVMEMWKIRNEMNEKEDEFSHVFINLYVEFFDYKNLMLI